MGELEGFAAAIVYASLFAVGMGCVTIYYQWKARPPLGMGIITTLAGVLVVILLIGEAVYRSEVPVEPELRSILYLGGLMVTSLGLVLLTVTTRAQVALREVLGEDEYHRLRTLRKRRNKATG